MATPLKQFTGFNFSESKKRILGEGLWTAGGQLAAAIGTVIGMRLLTEVVPPAIFGNVTVLLGLGTFGYNLFCTPLLNASCRFYSEAGGETGKLRLIITKSLRRSTSILASIILLGGVVYGLLQPVNSWAVAPLAGLLVLDVIRGLEMNFLMAARRQKEYAVWAAAEAWGRPLVAILAILLFVPSAGCVLFGYGLASLLCLSYFLLTVKREGGGRDSKPPEEALRRQIFDYARPLIPSAIVAWVMLNSDRYLIGGTLGLEQVGIYAATCGLVSRPLLLAGGILTQTLRPVYYNAVSAQNHAQERKIFQVWLCTAGLIGLAATVGFIVCGEWVMRLLLAKQYHSGVPLLPWVALGFSFLVVANTVTESFFAFKRTKLLVTLQIVATVIYVGLTIPCVMKFGLIGAAAAQAIYFCLYMSLLLFARKGRWAQPSTENSHWWHFPRSKRLTPSVQPNMQTANVLK